MFRLHTHCAFGCCLPKRRHAQSFKAAADYTTPKKTRPLTPQTSRQPRCRRCRPIPHAFLSSGVVVVDSSRSSRWFCIRISCKRCRSCPTSSRELFELTMDCLQIRTVSFLALFLTGKTHPAASAELLDHATET